MAVKVDFKNDGLSLSRAKKPVGYYRNYKSLYFHSNEKLDALVEKLYTLRKELEECSRDEEESVINRIKSLQEDVAGEIFKIYEVEYGTIVVPNTFIVLLCAAALVALLCCAGYLVCTYRVSTAGMSNNESAIFEYDDRSSTVSTECSESSNC